MATENVEILQVNTQPSVKSVADLKREIKELKGQLLNLEQGTAEYNKVLTEVANKTHDLKEVQEQVARSSNDFGDRLKNVQGTVAGLSGAFQTVLGSLSLMGVEMGDDVKMLKMLQSAMAITQGVAAIDTGVKAFKALTISIKASAMAMNGLKKALITSGIGVAAVAVGILVSKLSELSEKNREAEETTKAFTEAMERAKAYTGHLGEAYQSLIELVDFQARLDAASGKSAIEVNNAKLKSLQELLAKEKANLDNLRNYEATVRDAQKEEAIKMRKDQEAVVADLGKRILAIERENEVERTRQATEAAKKRAEAVANAAKATPVQNDTGAFTPTATQDTGAEAAQQADELQALTDYYTRRAEIMISGDTDAQDQLLQLDMDYRDKREELLRQRLDDGLITQQDFDNQLAQLEIEAVELQIEQEERLTDKIEEETKKRTELQKAQLTAYKAVAGAVSDILASISDTMEQGTEEWKALKIVQATIDTIQGGIAGFMSGVNSGLPAPYNLILAAATAASVVATGVAEIAKIRNTKVSKSSSGGGSVSTPSASAVSVNATQVTPTRQVQTDEDIANLPDTKVYVLEEDITNAQKKVQVTTENATY